jgi:hypothetical protein
MRAAIIIAMLVACTPPAAATTAVRGEPHAVELTAEDATVGEVLAALSAAFPLTYKAGPALERRVTGTYSGPLQRVLGVVLEGHDYIIKDSAGGLEIVALSARPSGLRALSGVAPPNPPRAAPARLRAASPDSVNSPTAGW